MTRSTRSPKAGRPPGALLKSRTTVAIRRDAMLLQSPTPRRIESRMAPPKYAERHHARPGAGIKLSRANTIKRS